MNNSNLTDLLNEYERKRLNSIHEAEERKKQIYNKNPRLQEIDDELSREAIKTSRLLITSSDSNLLDELNKKIEELKSEKENILHSLGNTLDDLKPKYNCEDCKDTCYISKEYKSEMCHCLKQKLYNLEYNKSNIYNLENQNFDNFMFDLYSDEPNEEKYNSSLSPRENISKISKLAHRFIENFDSDREKNLLFTGNTGLRKIFFIKLYSK